MPSSSLQALLARAGAALERGRGPEAAQLLAPALRSSTLTRDDELARPRRRSPRRWLLQDDLDQAAAALGRPPDTFRDTVSSGRLSTLWRLHGRLASARGDQSRAIALHGRALKQAEIAHDSRGIGLAHYELGQCYRQVGDIAIVREHITKAASALHAAGDRRHLALVHSLSSISLAQLGRYDEAMAALRQAERLASHGAGRRRAGDGLRQPGERDDAASTATSRRSRWPSAACRCTRRTGPGHGLAVALATLGQICVRLGDLARAEDALHRALDVRSPIQFHETTGAVFDTLAQIHLIRGRYDVGQRVPRRAPARRTAPTAARPASGTSGRCACSAPGSRCGAARSTKRSRAPTRSSQAGAPPFDALQATLIAAEALTAAGPARRRPEQRLASAADALDPRVAPAAWGEYLRLRGALHAQRRRAPPTPITTSRRARRCSICSASATRRRSATSRSAGSSPRPARARSPSATSTKALARLRAARRRTRPRRHARGARRC